MWQIEITAAQGERAGYIPLPDHMGPSVWTTFQLAFEMCANCAFDDGVLISTRFDFRVKNTDTGEIVYVVENNVVNPAARQRLECPQGCNFLTPLPTHTTQEREMPNNDSPLPSPPTSTAPLSTTQTELPLSPPPPLVSVNITRHKPTHRLMLVINAQPLHNLLDAIGVPHSNGIYTERPITDVRIARGEKLSTELFLRREYPVSVDLSSVLTAPVAHRRLEALADSAHEAVSKILEFYQPVDIQIHVVPKK